MWLQGLVFFFVIQTAVAEKDGITPVFQNTQEIEDKLRIIPEDTPFNVTIVTVNATERDKAITYDIAGEAAQFMSIGSTSGELKVKTKLDYENERFKDLSVILIAKDEDGDETKFETSAKVVDANDNDPYFTKNNYNFYLYENTSVGYIITDLRVDDIDTANGMIRVTCDNSTEEFAESCQLIRIQETVGSNIHWIGNLTLNQTLDYEKTNSYSVRLLASDGLNKITQEIFINVLDISDTPPNFERIQNNDIPEEQPVGTYIDYVVAVDKDEEAKRPIRYELYGNADALRKFKVDPVSGNITIREILDYDSTDPKIYTLEIRARELLSSSPFQLGNDSSTTATASVRIRVLDINDNCPVFDKSEYTVKIREGITKGSVLDLDMTVADKDSDKRGSFSLDLIDPTGTFKMGQTSVAFPAIEVSAVNIDFETTKTYVLQVTATPSEEGINQLNCSSNATVTIQVTDVNDQVPQFAQLDYTTTVKENAGRGTVLITITATDRDEGTFGTAGIRYTFVGSGVNLFEIDRLTGVVRVKNCSTPGVAPCIDYEVQKSYVLAVKASDNEGVDPNQSGSARLTINVEDVNDNGPRFSTSSYTRSVYEGQTITTDDLVISAVDKDGDTITYSIPPNQQDAFVWQIDSSTGNITARQPVYSKDLSNPERGSFIFEAMASDGLRNTLVNITISLLDVNDNTPVFQPKNYVVNIPEDSPPGTFVTTVRVTDGDLPSTFNGQVIISIDSGSVGKFVIQDNGTINGFMQSNIFTAPRSTFDYDVQDQYILILKGRDRGSPSRTGTATVTVNILDINNNDPYFVPTSQSVFISENAPVSSVVIQIVARDKDADNNLRISFTPTSAKSPAGDVTNVALYQNLFRISPSGLVTVNESLDRDIVSSLSFRLMVEDMNSSPIQKSFGDLTIYILEYNDQSPVFEYPFYNISVLEETPLGSFVDSILATDEDDQIASYRLVSNPGGLFAISSASGVLKVSRQLDYEAQHNVTLIAMAFDNGKPQLSASTTVFIRIININDNTPVFNESVYRVRLQEHSNTTRGLVTVRATDKDEGDYGVVEYSANDPYFRVDRYSGQVFLKPGADLDRETASTYAFQVTAYDSPLDASVRLNTTAPVYVILEDINDNCPVFSASSSYRGTVIETAGVGDQVLELFASDRDFGINRIIKFSMIDQPSGNLPGASTLFTIRYKQTTVTEQSGRIEVISSLRNLAGTYNFTVVASDRNGDNSVEMCSTSVPVSITVTEAINDAPVWVMPPSTNFSIDVLESQYKGMLVYDCKAHDVNKGSAGIIDYSFNVRQSLTQVTQEFRINPITCVIRAEVVFDREQVDSYVLTVVAKDRGDPSASSETVLIVNILDVNDNKPEFPMRNGETIPYNFLVEEGAGPGTVIGSVSATDRDTDHKNNEVFYKVIAGNDEGHFELDPRRGTLKISPKGVIELDREMKANYLMDILAYNEEKDDTVIRQRRRRSTDPSIVTVIVTVQDINDTPPEFVRSKYYGCIAQNAPFGQSILQVEATDKDVNRAQPLEYSKISETTDNYFTVDPNRGIIRNAKLLYSINSRVPVMDIQVADNANQESASVNNIAQTKVQIFVTDPSNEVMLQVSQPSASVRLYQDEMIRTMVNTSSTEPVSFVCIREIRDHINDDGSRSYVTSDVFLSAVYPQGGTYGIYSGDQLRGILVKQMDNYKTFHVTSVEIESKEDELFLTEDPVLAIFIIAILLLFLAIILFCLACCLIRNSKKKKMKKLRAEQHTHVEVVRQQPPPQVIPSVNPVYDNQGFQGGDEYAVVQKRPAPEPMNPPIVPVMVPAVDDESISEVPVHEPEPEPEPEQGPEPVIITEPIMSEEQSLEMLPPPSDSFEPEIEVIPAPPELSEPNPVIETVIETELVPDDEDDYYIPEASQTSPEDAIEVEFGDIQDSPPDSPSLPRSRSRSPSPPPHSTGQEYRIDTNVM